MKTTHFSAVVPHFSVADVVKTAEYYRDTLGFKIAGYWDGEQRHEDPSRAAIFGIVLRDDVRLHFNKADGAPSARLRTDGAYDVYFHVSGIQALADEVTANGATIIDGPTDRVYGQRELVIRDCNDLVVAFGQAI